MAGTTLTNQFTKFIKGFSLGDLFGAAPSTLIGLSIGSSAIKLVELKKSGKSWKLLHFGIVQLPDDVIVNREIVNQVSVVENINTLINQIKLSSRHVCTSLSGTSLIIKRMTLDVPKLRDLESQIFWEAEQYLPFDINEVVMDYQMLSRGKDNKTDVILVAVKKVVLESYMACIEEAGLQPKIVDIDYFAMANLFEQNYPNNPSEAVAIVDFGASALKLAVLQDTIPVFTKDIAMGGHNLTAEIMKHLKLSYNDAETIKMEGQNGAMPQEISELMHLMCENFATEIKRALDFYNASSSGAPVSSLLMTGGSAKIPGLAKIIEEGIKVPCQILNPFNCITYDSSIFTQDYLNAIAPIAAIPIGLAIRAGEKRG